MRSSCFISWCFILLFFPPWQFDFFCETHRDWKKKTDPGFFAEEELSMRSTEFWLSFCKSSVFHGKNTAHKKRTSIDSRTETRQINRSKHTGCTKRRTRRVANAAQIAVRGNRMKISRTVPTTKIINWLQTLKMFFVDLFDLNGWMDGPWQ